MRRTTSTNPASNTSTPKMPPGLLKTKGLRLRKIRFWHGRMNLPVDPRKAARLSEHPRKMEGQNAY